MPRNNALNTLLRGWSFCLPVWIVLSLLLALQLAHVASMPMMDALRVTAADWFGWVVVSPLLYLLTKRLPLEKGSWHRALPAHLLAGFAAILIIIGMHFLIGMPPRPPGREIQREHRPEPDQELTHKLHLEGPGQRLTQPFPKPPNHEGPRARIFPEWFYRLMLPFFLPVYFVVLTGAHALYFYKRGQEREKKALELASGLVQARLDALKSQIQPHFLFNALNSIAALVHKDPAAADEMIGALSEFLRCTLAGSARQEVPLLEELEFVRRYLAIELVRFGDRLKCEQDIPPETFDALVPMLILQPLVENAVRHGLSAISGPAQLTIRARREEQMLRIEVADNGPGPGSETGEGIGLANTRARLRELHGDKAHVELRTSGGCTVEITLPYRTA